MYVPSFDIYIKTLTGKTLTVGVSGGDTAGDVKVKIQALKEPAKTDFCWQAARGLSYPLRL